MLLKMPSYKILRISSIHPYHDVYESLFQDLPYEEIMDLYRKKGLFHPPGFASYFRELGHEVLEVAADFPQLQRRWCLENERQYIEGIWPLLEEQIKTFRPEVIYFERSSAFYLVPIAERKRLKESFPWIKVVCGMWGTTGVDYKCFRDIDLMFCMDTAFEEGFKKAGVRAKLCHHCYDDFLDRYLEDEQKNEDFVFLGVSGYCYADHRERYSDLVWLMLNSCLKIWTHERNGLKEKTRLRILRCMQFFPRKVLKSLYAYIAERQSMDTKFSRVLKDSIHFKEVDYPYDWLKTCKPLHELFPDRASSPLFGLDYFHLLKQSKVVLNRHTDDPAHGGNIRTFEVCGVGSCLLTDRKEQIKHLFQEDEEVMFYSSKEECLEKAKFLLENEKVRDEMGRRAKERVAKEHTFRHRAALMDETIKKLL